MTLKGAAQVMRRSSQDELARQTQLLERLQRIRAALIEVREELKTGDGEQVVEESGDDDVEVAVAAETPAKKPAKRVAKPKTEPEPETLEVVAEPAEEDEVAEEQPKRRAPRRKKKSDDETKELFPFYEQSLF